MEFLWKVILVCLWLDFYCTGGYVYNRHEIEKRDVNATIIDVSEYVVKSILSPIANIADKYDITLPLISGFSTKN